MDSPYADIAAFTRLPRSAAMTLSPDGRWLVITVQSPDAKQAQYLSSLWRVSTTPGAAVPRQLTESTAGETGAAFAPDGSLLFVSARAAPDGPAPRQEPALWSLPPHGEARRIAVSPGGLGPPRIAADSGVILAAGSRVPGSRDATEDEARRARREDRAISAIVHTGMPIRSWDHEVGAASPRLMRVGADGEVHDLTADATTELVDAEFSIDAAGDTAACTWQRRYPHGQYRTDVVLIDAATGARRVLADSSDGAEYLRPVIAPDGSRVAVLRHHPGTFSEPMTVALQLRAVGAVGGETREVPLGDVYPASWVWSADGATLYVAGDWRGRGVVLAVDVDTGALRRLAADGLYSDLCPAPDGTALYALRSSPARAAQPVRLDVAATDQRPVELADPAESPPIPGTLREITASVAGAEVRGWLCLPEPGDHPAPLMVWVHGGPFSSWNAWAWRWNPWVAVARGWAVLLPDPALSTGYGPAWFARAWPHRAAPVWRDIEALLDAALAGGHGLDAGRLACLGGSFGGYVTNWIAGHTDRFGAIVTHAGLWALEQQHTTSDHAEWKSGLFGLAAEHPEWYAENSPNRFVERIGTPMLVSHGNRDYRVPVSEALRLWWDLVSHHEGDPATLPHRFLQFTAENHWVLGVADAQIWYETVLGFCDEQVRGRPWTPSDLL